MHRRVESYSFVDQWNARKEVSIDFTVPTAPSAVRSANEDLLLVPLTQLPKRTLTNFDLVDESGRSLPMLTRAQHQRVATEALFVLAMDELTAASTHGSKPQASGESQTPGQAQLTELRNICADITRARPGMADDALKAFYKAGLKSGGRSARLAQVFADSFYVLVAVPAEPGRRRVLKFSHDEQVGDPDPGRLTEIWRGLGWRAKPVIIAPIGLGDHPSYHLEVQAPPGLWIVRRDLLVTGLRTRSHRGPYTRARFYLLTQPDSRAHAVVALRPQSSTLVRAAALVSWLALILLASVLFSLWWGGFEDNDTTMPALLLFLPGAASALLVRAGEHAMTTDMLWLMRVVTLAPSALAFIGGLAVAALPHGSDALPYLFGGLALAAYVPTAMLTYAWQLCRVPTVPGHTTTEY
jgi:hypothetical protein